MTALKSCLFIAERDLAGLMKCAIRCVRAACTVLAPLFAFVMVATLRPLPQSAPYPVAEIVECIGAVDKSVVVAPSSNYRVQCLDYLFGRGCLICGNDFTDFVT